MKEHLWVGMGAIMELSHIVRVSGTFRDRLQMISIHNLQRMLKVVNRLKRCLCDNLGQLTRVKAARNGNAKLHPSK